MHINCRQPAVSKDPYHEYGTCHIPTQCRHYTKEYLYAREFSPTQKQLTSEGNISSYSMDSNQVGAESGESNSNAYLVDLALSPEKHFEPYRINNNDEQKQSLDPTPLPRHIEQIIAEPFSDQYFSRNYGYEEDPVQNEKQLANMAKLWDVERIAIQKLQHDLDKNIFQKTFDYVKHFGQSVVFALWLWTHRPTKCSQLANQLSSTIPGINVRCKTTPTRLCTHQKKCEVCPPCSDNFCCHEVAIDAKQFSEDQDDEKDVSCINEPSSLFLKHLILDEQREYLPPITRALKNMLDNNYDYVTDETKDSSILWPHYINMEVLQKSLASFPSTKARSSKSKTKPKGRNSSKSWQRSDESGKKNKSKSRSHKYTETSSKTLHNTELQSKKSS
ncbi:unnamed protein product [Didymodactylos carnosus]|uniref:Uncharacterized protein n=1 Tax=Didymodactylos carnosus TaxID=1234261 RepID=A0A813RMY3_9BILA|nr:unnamed protein product [Didymodactylos carnosus]CAF3567885.1 unnamed protein product [Didymodactylos carnosus]